MRVLLDLRTVQELMGHKTITMTLRYSHLSPAHQLDAVQRLNRPATGTSTKAPKVAVSGAAEASAASSDSRERATGVEPATSSLGSWHSTTELRPHRVETLAEPVAPRNPGAPGTPAPAAN